MSVKKLLFAAALMAGMVKAQSPYEVAPETYHLDFENEYVRIVRVTLAPNVKVPVHDHPASPTIYVYTQDGGPITFNHSDGTVKERPAVKQGQIRFSHGQADTHWVVNGSDRENDYLRVELKTRTGAVNVHVGRVAPASTFENSMVKITRNPEGASNYRAVDVNFATGKGVFRQPGEAGPVPDVRIELKTSPVTMSPA